MSDFVMANIWSYVLSTWGVMFVMIVIFNCCAFNEYTPLKNFETTFRINSLHYWKFSSIITSCNFKMSNIISFRLDVTRFSTMKCKHDANLLENVPTALVEMFSSFFIFHAGAVVAQVWMTKWQRWHMVLQWKQYFINVTGRTKLMWSGTDTQGYHCWLGKCSNCWRKRCTWKRACWRTTSWT